MKETGFPRGILVTEIVFTVGDSYQDLAGKSDKPGTGRYGLHTSAFHLISSYVLL